MELLQQLLFWQERSKVTAPYNVAKRKRLVSGLRCCSLLQPVFRGFQSLFRVPGSS